MANPLINSGDAVLVVYTKFFGIICSIPTTWII